MSLRRLPDNSECAEPCGQGVPGRAPAGGLDVNSAGFLRVLEESDVCTVPQHEPQVAVLVSLALAKDEEIVGEFERRFPRLSDTPRRTCDHICPRCSTAANKVFGTWDRDRWRFYCDKCGFVLSDN